VDHDPLGTHDADGGRTVAVCADVALNESAPSDPVTVTLSL
jgi:hypothetical protein